MLLARKEFVQLSVKFGQMLHLQAISELAAHHDAAHVAQRLQIVKRVGVKHDQICRFPHLDGTGLIAQANDARVAQRGRMQRKLAASANDALEIHQFAPHVVLRDIRARGVRSQTNGNAGCQRLLRGIHDALVNDAPVRHLHVG